MRKILILTALSLLAASCGGSHRAQTAASPEPDVTATQVLAKTPSATTTTVQDGCSSLVNDERAPFVQAISFVDRLHAYALAIALSDSRSLQCVYLADTTDGGQTWARLQNADVKLPRAKGAAGNSEISGIEFATLQDGWLYGPGLWGTHDGGLTWQEESPGFVVNSVVASGNDGWALETVPCGTDSCARISVANEGNSWRWTPLSAQSLAVPGLEPVKLLRPTWQRALISFVGRQNGFGRGALAATNNAGATWEVLETPFAAKGQMTDAEAFGDLDVWLTYGGSTATSMQSKEIYHSADGGSTWQLVADVQLPAVGQLSNLPSSGYGPKVTALSASKLFLSMGRSALYVSIDAGKTWTPAIDDELASGGADSVRLLGFGDELHGFATSMGTRWATADGGRTWSRVALPR